MEQSICAVSIAPLRKEPSHRSEMVSQLLLGEIVTCLETSGDFVFIHNSYDGYSGWCQKSQLLLTESEDVIVGPEQLAAAFINPATWNGWPMMVPLSAPVGNLLQLRSSEFTLQGKLHQAGSIPFNTRNVLDHSSLYHQTPYAWGGKSVYGIDCSGFCQQVYRFFGKKLPRDASQQAIVGEMVGFLEEVQCGDLAFFDNEEGNITHVGLLLNTKEIIHASGKVRVDDIDQWGIINRDTGQRTHTLRLIRRYA